MFLKNRLVVILLANILLVAQSVWGEVEVTAVGIASPQNKAEKSNLEKLRERALRNAIDIALMQVTGATVSGERGNSYRSNEVENIQTEAVVDGTGDSVESTATAAEIEVTNRYSANSVTKTEGHARLLEIIDEWGADGLYHVKARFSIETNEEAVAKRNAGYYWKKAGSPVLSLDFTETHNGDNSDLTRGNTLKFFRDNLIRNKLNISGSGINPRYIFDINQTFESSELTGLDTITMNCRLSFRLLDVVRNTTLYEHRASSGPAAGFNLEQAASECVKPIAGKAAESIVREFVIIMNDQIQNGQELVITILNVPGKMYGQLSDITQNIYRVTQADPAQLNSSTFLRKVRFKGTNNDFIQAASEIFAEKGWNISVLGVGGGNIRLKWGGFIENSGRTL